MVSALGVTDTSRAMLDEQAFVLATRSARRPARSKEGPMEQPEQPTDDRVKILDAQRAL